MLKGCSASRIFSCASSLRTRSYSSIATANRETVTVSCGSNGNISLDILQPIAAAPLHVPRILIYLPRGPSLGVADHDNDESTLATLNATLPWTVVRINYRWTKAARYPTPIHDVLCGFDWIKEHLLPRRAITRAGRSEHVGRLAACGELIGGGLATMLALTECRINEAGIAAAAVSNPLVDWVDLSLAAAKKSRKTSKSPASKPPEPAIATSIADMRDVLFRKPEHYFDPFASPMLFFRTAGVEVPDAKPEPPTDEFEILSRLDQEDFHRQQLALSAISGMGGQYEVEADQNARSLRRASRRYPAAKSGLRLPRFHISAGELEPYRRQAFELSNHVRTSHMRQAGLDGFGKKELLDEEIRALGEDEREELFAREADFDQAAMLQLNQGPGLWNETTQGRSSLLKSVKWLKEELQ